MKLIFKLIVVCTIKLSAQTYPLSQRPALYSLPTNAYVKDVDHDYDRFIGTWKSDVDGKILPIVLKKREMVYDERYHIYTDILTGEYSYSENGVEFVNTLPNIDQTTGLFNNNIAGGVFLRPQNYPVCATCGETARDRVELAFMDPERPDTFANIVIQHINDFENTTVLATIYTSTILVYYDNQPFNLRVPTGNYVLIKQP